MLFSVKVNMYIDFFFFSEYHEKEISLGVPQTYRHRQKNPLGKKAYNLY